MSEVYESWVSESRRRRGLEAAPRPFARGLLAPGTADRLRAWQAVAVALVSLVGGRHGGVSFRPGGSWARLRTRRVNLDGTLLDQSRRLDQAGACVAGAAVHEGAHLWRSRPLPPDTGPLYAWLHNVIEDERIERAAVRRYPGLAEPLESARAALLRVEPRRLSKLESLFVLVRAPQALPFEAWQEHEGLLRAAMDAMRPFPDTPASVRRSTERLLALLPAWMHAEWPAGLLAFDGFHGHDVIDETSGLDGALGLPGGRRGGRRRRPTTEEGVVGRYPPVVWRTAPPERAAYDACRREVEGQAARFAAGLRSLAPPAAEPRERRGTVDRRRLWAHRVDGRVFRRARPGRPRMTLALVLDLSGSMLGSSERRARRLAVTVAEGAALARGVRLHVYGHTADGGEGPTTEIVRFATPARGAVPALGRLPIGHNNRDAHAAEVIGRDLLSQEGAGGEPRAVLWVCDGAPSAQGFRGAAALDATRRAFHWLHQVFGPVLVLATARSPDLERMVAQPWVSLEDDAPVERVIGGIAWAFRRR